MEYIGPHLVLDSGQIDVSEERGEEQESLA
jgi:hypothetical protein